MPSGRGRDMTDALVCRGGATDAGAGCGLLVVADVWVGVGR